MHKLYTHGEVLAEVMYVCVYPCMQVCQTYCQQFVLNSLLATPWSASLVRPGPGRTFWHLERLSVKKFLYAYNYTYHHGIKSKKESDFFFKGRAQK